MDVVELPAGVVVRRYRVGMTGRRWVYQAWQPAIAIGCGQYDHHTLTVVDGQTYGRVGTCDLPEELEWFPAWSRERIEAYWAWHTRECERAYKLISLAFPAVTGRRWHGEIEYDGPAE